ncbi:MAG: DUF898 family protein [Proteobacteria bacterium]|nr:DUF898 family protein [Pseudomonadota bacterium]
MNISAVQPEGSQTGSPPSRPVYDGRLAELYGIYLRHLLLMLVTFGWSRFWGRTRLRRYLWSHVSVLGDRFEYRGRGLELFVGFVMVLLILAAWAGALWLAWTFWLSARLPAGMGLIGLVGLSIAVIGFPLSFVGQYAALRYKLSRTRWRGVRGAMAGSAWRYGALATLLTAANGATAQLLTPLMSVTLARPRISNAAIGTQRFAFAGNAGDIYGRYIAYYLLNILVTVGLVIAVFMAVGVAFVGHDLKEFQEYAATPPPLLIAAGLAAAYILFGLVILPLRCWWQAYLLRYLIARTRAGDVLFATSLTTRDMWGFLVLNYLIVLLSFGLGWPWVMHRTLRLIAGRLWIYGAPAPGSIAQPADRGPNYGEGLLDMFDVSGV